jgi:hypothetical protein
MANDIQSEFKGVLMTTATSEPAVPLTLAPDASADFNAEFLSELQELAAEVAEALGDDLVAVLLGGRYGRSEGAVTLHQGAETAGGNVNLYLVTESHAPRGMAKLPHLARRYEHRLRISIVFSRPITPEMIDKWPAELTWQELALGHRVLYGPQDILAARVPRRVLEPLPTLEATRLLLNAGAGLIWATRLADGVDDISAGRTSISRLYFDCAQAIADALLIGCQRFCTDPLRKQGHLREMARFESIVDQSGALLHLQRACEFRRAPDNYVISAHHLQEIAQDWQCVFLWIESVRLGLRFPDLEKYAAWKGRREGRETSIGAAIFANLRHRRLGWVHPRERAYRMLAIAVSDLANDRSRLPFTSEAALQQWRQAQ